jgi:hypothetical protein
MRNLTIGYIVFVVAFASVWVAIIPTQEELMEKHADVRFATVVRSLESEIITRFGTEEIEGNLTIMVYTYHNVTVTDYVLSNNETRMTLYFDVTSIHRVKQFGLIKDEYEGELKSMSIAAHLEGDFWTLDIASAAEIDQ